MFKYTHISMEELAEDISGFVYSCILSNHEKLRPVIKDMSLEEQMAIHKLLMETILDRLRASEG